MQPDPNLPTTPPADATLPVRHPKAPAPGERLGSHYARCFGCGDEQPAGLHMQTFAGPGLSVSAEFKVTQDHQGAPGLAHGGMLALAFDEALGALNWLLLTPAVTGRLETDFRRPVKVDEVLHIDAEIVGQSGRKIYTRAVGRIGGSDGEIATTAAALFVQVPLEHFRNHGRTEDVDRVAVERAHGAPEVEWDVNP